MLKPTALIVAAGLCSAAAHAQQYDLEYDYTDGSLTITGVVPYDDGGTPGRNGNETQDDFGGLINYVLESQTPVFLETEDFMDHTNHLRPINAFDLNGQTFYFGGAASTPMQIAASHESANGLPGVLKPVMPLGNLLPPGLSEPEYNDIFFIRTYVTSLGRPKGTFNLVYVPEPTSLALLSLGGLAVMRRRR